jgi:D-sedoheptulose 7-phosphate isomerase
MKSFNKFKAEFVNTLQLINENKFYDCVKMLQDLRKRGGRLFIIGVGGSAANASHAVNDFRKICNIEAYCPTDNVSELTARTNDDGFEYIFQDWFKTSKVNKRDLILIFSVGGGNLKKKVSINIINALKYANKNKTKSICFVGKKNGYAFRNSSVSIYFNVNNKKLVTPISEAMQAVIWHALVSDPLLQINKTKW